MIFKIIIFSFLLSPVFAEDNTQVNLVSIESGNDISDAEYRILKLETKIQDLISQLRIMQEKLDKIDLIQAQISEDLNNLKPQEDEEIIEAHLNDNIGEFKYGFEMLTSGNYDRARRSFRLFIEKYPNDLKLGEAYFWLGEIAYKSKDYKDSSKNYLISYRDYSENSRRNDALFKLSIVLNLLGKKEEACAGFDILINDSGGVIEPLRDKAINESIKTGCQNN